MGKVVKFTGSKLLGAELRRLRGGRSLKQISELSKSPPLCERIAPLAAPTLSQIENGISFPSLETIHSLAHLYKRPVQQLLDLVVQERIQRGMTVPTDLNDAMENYAESVAAGDWHRALSLALWAEGQTEGAAQVQWRANRAQVLRMLGLAHDAIDLLEECVEYEGLAPGSACQIHQALADAMAKVGLIRSAALHSAKACELAPVTLSEKARRRLLRGRAYILIMSNVDAAEPNQREARDAGRLLTEALQLTTADDAVTRSLIGVQLAWTRLLEGNALVAANDLKTIVEEARTHGRSRVLLEGLHALGFAMTRLKQRASAISSFEEAGSLAAEADDAEMAFESYLKLYELTSSRSRERGEHYLRRCERFYPLVMTRSKAVQRFELLTRVELG